MWEARWAVLAVSRAPEQSSTIQLMVKEMSVINVLLKIYITDQNIIHASDIRTTKENNNKNLYNIQFHDFFLALYKGFSMFSLRYYFSTRLDQQEILPEPLPMVTGGP